MSTWVKLKKISLCAVGCVSLVLGIAGIILPVLPTTPFLLLTAACFAKGSDRFYHWLITHRWFGEYIENYRSGRGMPMKTKIATISLLWLSIGTSVIFFVDFFPAKVIMLVIASCVSGYLITRPTLKTNN